VAASKPAVFSVGNARCAVLCLVLCSIVLSIWKIAFLDWEDAMIAQGVGGDCVLWLDEVVFGEK
jgi:hypothetical protein